MTTEWVVPATDTNWPDRGGTLPPIARRTDPETSHEAASLLTGRVTLMDIALATVRETPGLTAGEIGDRTGLGHARVWRRLSDLKNLGKIVAGTPRKWQGRNQQTWYPVDHQTAMFQ